MEEFGSGNQAVSHRLIEHAHDSGNGATDLLFDLSGPGLVVFAVVNQAVVSFQHNLDLLENVLHRVMFRLSRVHNESENKLTFL